MKGFIPGNQPLTARNLGDILGIPMRLVRDIIFSLTENNLLAETTTDSPKESAYLPAIDINKSGTRKEELLLDEDTLNRVWILRKLLSPLNPIDSLEFLLEKMNGTKNNKHFLESMNT